MIELIIIAIVVFFVWSSLSNAKKIRKVQKSAENCKAYPPPKLTTQPVAFPSILPVIREVGKSFKWI